MPLDLDNYIENQSWRVHVRGLVTCVRACKRVGAGVGVWGCGGVGVWLCVCAI